MEDPTWFWGGVTPWKPPTRVQQKNKKYYFYVKIFFIT